MAFGQWFLIASELDLNVEIKLVSKYCHVTCKRMNYSLPILNNYYPSKSVKHTANCLVIDVDFTFTSWQITPTNYQWWEISASAKLYKFVNIKKFNQNRLNILIEQTHVKQ